MEQLWLAYVIKASQSRFQDYVLQDKKKGHRQTFTEVEMLQSPFEDYLLPDMAMSNQSRLTSGWFQSPFEDQVIADYPCSFLGNL